MPIACSNLSESSPCILNVGSQGFAVFRVSRRFCSLENLDLRKLLFIQPQDSRTDAGMGGGDRGFDSLYHPALPLV